MIFQLKKFFVSMVFTVALCCGLSVSASAFEYNLSDLTFTDGISLHHERDISITSDSAVYAPMIWTVRPPTTILTGEPFYFNVILPFFDFGSIPVDLSSSYFRLSFTESFLKSMAVTFYYADNSVELYSSDNISPNLQFSLIGSESSPIGFSFSGIAPFDIDNWLLEVTAPLTSSDRPLQSTGTITFSSYADFIVSDSPIDLAPVYNPQISASQFSVTSTTFTSEVFLIDLDPSKTYRPYWSLYKQSDLTTPISQGYSNQIGDVTGVEYYTGYSRVVDLKPDTDYLINWNLYEVGSFPIPTASEVRFTTLSDGSSGGGSGTTDDSGGILLLILNKVSAILDAISGGSSGDSEGILSSVDEKLEALVDTLANPAEQAVETAVESTTQNIADQIYNNDSLKITADTVSDTATIGSSIKSFFTSNVSVGEFFNLFNDNFLVSWFSEETAADLNTVPSVATFSLDDTLSEGEQLYYGDRDKLFSFLGIGGVD